MRLQLGGHQVWPQRFILEENAVVSLSVAMCVRAKYKENTADNVPVYNVFNKRIAHKRCIQYASCMWTRQWARGNILILESVPVANSCLLVGY